MKPFALLAALAGSTLALPAMAALPPHYQRIIELKAVLDSSAVVDALVEADAPPIERVEWVHDDIYRVTAGACSVDAEIRDTPVRSGMVGPRRFKVVAGKVDCTSKAD